MHIDIDVVSYIFAKSANNLSQLNNEYAYESIVYCILVLFLIHLTKLEC